jgi:hypothetical protein
LARIWRWHIGWCPSWKAYQKELAQPPEGDVPQAASSAK